VAGRAGRLDDPLGLFSLERGQPLRGGAVRGVEARFGQERERPAEAPLQDLEQQEAEPEGRALHRGIVLARHRVREGGHVRLLDQEVARFVVHPPGRIRRGLAPDFVHQRLIDASHGRRNSLRPTGDVR